MAPRNPKPAMPGAPNPQDLRAIFGRNLRMLAAGEPSVSDLCRRLDINRTQFNRYLSGEAFPRPDILHRICNHFSVDARILLEPLSDIPAGPTGFAAAICALAGQVTDTLDWSVERTILPGGFYRLWRRSFARPDWVVQTVCRISHAGEVTRLRTYEPIPGPFEIGSPEMRYVHHPGVVLRAEDGFTILCPVPGTRMLRLSFLRPGLGGVAGLYPGYSVLTRDRTEGMLRAAATLMERLPPGLGPALAAARQRGYHKPDDLPGMLRDFVMQPHPV